MVLKEKFTSEFRDLTVCSFPNACKAYLKTCLLILCFLITTFSLNIGSDFANAALIDVTASTADITLGEIINVEFEISGLSNSPGDSLSAFDLDILFR